LDRQHLNIQQTEIMKLHIRKEKQRGNIRYVLDYIPDSGERERRQFRTKAEAEAALQEKRELIGAGGQAWLSLTAHERADLIMGYERIKKLNLTLGQILDRYENGFCAAPQNGNGKSMTLGQAGQEWEVFMRAKGNTERHTEDCKRWIRKFSAGRELMPVSGFTTDKVLEYLNQYDNRTTWNRNRDYARAFFAWAFRKKYIAENPCESDLLPKKKQDRNHQARIFTPDEMIQWFTYGLEHPELLGYITLATWCGIRPEECDQVSWNDVHLESAEVDVRHPKIPPPRTVHLHPTALEWLKLAKELGSPIGADFATSKHTKVRRMKPLVRHMGWSKLPNDIQRKSFGSYHVELFRSHEKTATEMGNSAAIIKKHYKAPISKADVKKFWAITPDFIRSLQTQNH
jgi:hypothetical protein